VTELAVVADLKSAVLHGRVGSSPTPGTSLTRQYGDGRPSQNVHRNLWTGGGCTAVALIDAGLAPLVPYVYGTTPRRRRCNTCGRKVKARGTDLRRGQGGCIYCAPGRLDLTAPGVLYLITHTGWQAAKIGITTKAARIDRLDAHAQYGWEVAHTWNLPTGANAYDAEQEVVSRWREAGYPDVVPPEEMPQGG
jgi:hypothetical protein